MKSYRLIAIDKKCTLLFLTICLIATGCAGKDKPTPAEVEALAFNDIRSEIRTVISDTERMESAIVIANELETSFEGLRLQLEDRSTEVQALNADYDAPKEDYIALFGEIQKDMERNQRHISGLHRKLVEVTTAEEWAKLKKLRNATMESAIASIQSS